MSIAASIALSGILYILGIQNQDATAQGPQLFKIKLDWCLTISYMETLEPMGFEFPSALDNRSRF